MTKTNKSKVQSIALQRLDGRRDEIGIKAFNTWSEANKAIVAMTKTAPVTSGHEVDFRVQWDDSACYSGALELHYEPGAEYDLAGRIRFYIEVIAGLRKPGHLSELDYTVALAKIPAAQRAYWAEFVQHHELSNKRDTEKAAVMYADELLDWLKPTPSPASVPGPALPAKER
jgi:hypothetical protein